MKDTWRIGELARAHNLNPKTIRYYEELGLLPPPTRSASGYRLYGEGDRARLAFIGKAKAIGLTLADIRDILALRDGGTQPCSHVVTLLDQKLAAVERQIQELAAFREELLVLRAQASGIQKAGGCICSIIEQGVTAASPRLLRQQSSYR